MKKKKNQPLLVVEIVTVLAVNNYFQFTGNDSDQFQQAHVAHLVEECQRW